MTVRDSRDKEGVYSTHNKLTVDEPMPREDNDFITVVALGGNAILQRGEEGTFEEQYQNVLRTSSKIAKLIRNGRKIVITHGNGPQVGATLIRHEAARQIVPPFPLHACVSETQGLLGYMIQQSLQSELARLGLNKLVVTIITQVLIDAGDPAFLKPTKPIGPFYNEEEKNALVRDRQDLILREDSGRGFRRVVPSPDPKVIVESEAIKKLVDGGVVVIASGGGGIPVVESKGRNLQGVDAVIDKDLAAEKLATSIRARELAIMTDVEGVYLNYGKQNRRLLSRITRDQLAEYARKEDFAAGSMGPKVEAALRFLKNGGERAVIAQLDTIQEAIEGNEGTQITR